MTFKMKYSIAQSPLTAPSKRRSGLPLEKPKFIVLHDTGNPGSTARGNVRYYENSRNLMEASAHMFVDDKEIIECIPAVEKPEKAWHVIKGVTLDNEMFGANANDAALGLEYCYGGSINADEAYKRFIWLAAFLCHKHGMDPANSLVGHFFLDPARKTDPVTGLAHSRRTYEQLLRDIAAEYEECTGAGQAAPSWPEAGQPGNAKVVMPLNVRRGAPATKAPLVRTYPPGVVLPYLSWVDNGQSVNGNSRWYRTSEGDYFWSGGTVKA